MQVHILMRKYTSPFKFEIVPLASVELEVVPKGLYVIGGTTYRTVDVPKFVIDETRSGHELNHVEIVVEVPNET